MKNKITCLLASAALFGATANAEIVLADGLSAYGYIDMALEDSAGDNTETSVAEFELGFAFTPAESQWSAAAELSFGENDVEWETVTITYALSDELKFTAGNILSYQGFESFDATDMYQYTYAGAGNERLYSAGYAVGACVDYTTDAFALGAWIGDTAGSDNSFEFLAAFTGVENLTVTAVYADDPGYETVNVWAEYVLGDLTFAVEHVETDEVDGSGVNEVDVQTALVYYSFGSAGITLRYADGEWGGQDYEKYTISPSYSFSDNVLALVEFSTEELNDVEQDTAAVELIYSF